MILPVFTVYLQSTAKKKEAVGKEVVEALKKKILFLFVPYDKRGIISHIFLFCSFYNVKTIMHNLLVCHCLLNM